MEKGNLAVVEECIDKEKRGGQEEHLYFVDFPSDEEVCEHGNKCQIRESDESLLVSNMTNVLSLKRPREGPSSQALMEYVLETDAKKIREEPLAGHGGDELAMEIFEYGTMVEEAGLPMPPPEP